MGPTTPTADGIGRELAELRAAAAALAETARRLDARATALEHLLATAPPEPAPPAPARPLPPPGAVLPAGPRRAKARPGSSARPRGRHRSTGPGARRRAAGGVALGLAVALPWLFCVSCFALAIGLLAVSTFG